MATTPAIPTNSPPTFPRRLEAVVDVYPLDVIRERRVWQQSPVSVDVVDGELERQLLGADQRDRPISLLKDPA